MSRMSMIFIGTGLSVFIYFTFFHSLPKKQEIIIPPQPVNEKAAIEQMVKQYYSCLREGKYKDAVAFYEKDTFTSSGIDPAKALEAACRIGELPNSVKIEAIRIEGNQAVGEIIIDRPGIGPIYYELKDENGKSLGTWARSLNFVKQNEQWKIAKKNHQTLNGTDDQTKKALELLNQMKKKS